MTRISRGVGQYVASEAHRVVWARTTKVGAQAAIFCPGSHDGADSTYSVARVNMEALAQAGFIVGLLDMAQSPSQGTFGNATAQARIGQMRTFLQGTSSPLRAAAGKVHLVGGSGGVAAALNFARANPSLVASIAGIVPLTDLQDFYENRTDGQVTQAEVRAAYSGGVPDYATYSPAATGNQAALIGVPIKLWYSTNDPYIPVSTVVAYQGKVQGAGGTCVISSLGAVGHSDSGLSYEGPAVGDVSDWLAYHS
jgi:predicted esterase